MHKDITKIVLKVMIEMSKSNPPNNKLDKSPHFREVELVLSRLT